MKYLLMGCLGVLLWNCTPTNTSELPERPNIVWITSEDNSKHYLSLFDENGVETPHIKALADEGVLFSRAFSNAPVCSVARSALISGCYGPRIGTQYHRKEKIVPMPNGVEMFPAYLKKAGYHTTNNSKEDYNLIKSDSVWDESSKNASWTQRNEGQPFFHVFNIGTTHESGLHFTKENMATTNTNTPLTSFTVQPNHPNTALFKYTNARYRDKIQKMDQQLGEIVTKLKEEGLLETTFIFYFGDHGGVLPGSKGYLYETGLHVPLVVYIPETYKHMSPYKKGSETKGFVDFVDFGPTVLHLAGIAVPKGMDGQPFMGNGIASETMVQQNETFGYADRYDEKYDLVRSLRKGTYKYIRNFQPFNFDGLMNNYRYKQLAFEEWQSLYKAGKLNGVQAQFFKARRPEQLFDITADPYETQNLAQDPDHAEKLVELRNRLSEYAKEMNDLSFYPESYLVQNAFNDPTQFGQDNRHKIAGYIDVANLGLMEFDKAKQPLEDALRSNDPWERYWGLIVCSTFNSEAMAFVNSVKQIARTDSELLNRVRAAEFLGIIGAEDPSEVMANALYETKDGTEALLILNSMVLLQDGEFGYAFSIDSTKIITAVKENVQVARRLDYLGLL